MPGFIPGDLGPDHLMWRGLCFVPRRHLLLHAIRVNGKWLQVNEEGAISNSTGRVVAKIYEATPAGRQIADRLFASMEEQQMSDIVIGVVPQKERFAALLAGREKIRSGVQLGIGKAGETLSWIVETFHLGGLVSMVKSSWEWTTATFSKGISAAGTVGLVGLGMAVVGSEFGRKVVRNTVGKLVGLIGSVGSKLYDWTTTGLRKLWTPGKWIADQMDKGVGLAAKGIAKVTGWWNKYVAKHVAVESAPMVAVKTIGVTMAMVKTALVIPNPILSGVVMAGAVIYGGLNGLGMALYLATKVKKVEASVVVTKAEETVVVAETPVAKATRLHRAQPNRKPRRTTAELKAAGLKTRAGVHKAASTKEPVNIETVQAELELPSTKATIKESARQIADEIITEQEAATTIVKAAKAPVRTKAQQHKIDVAARRATASARKTAKSAGLMRPIPAT